MTDQPAAWLDLLHLLAMAWDPDMAEPPSSIPWPDLLRLARSQEVAHLLHLPSLRISRPLPEAAASELREAYLKAGALNSLRYRELAAVQDILDRLDVPVLLLKGAALAETLYRNAALRPMGDLDLAVPANCAAECRETLIASGYRPVEIEERPGFHLAHRSEQVYMPPPPFRSPVALHWHPLDLPYYLRRVPEGWFWDNAVPAECNGRRVQVLTTPANLLYLAAHLALHHRFRGLPWLVDLAWLIHGASSLTDWQEIIADASRFELILPLRGALDRLSGLWPSLGLNEPRRALWRLRPTSGERRIFRLLTAEPRSPFLDFASDIAGLPDFPARLRFILANTFPQVSYMRQRYPTKHSWQMPFWYAYRLGDGACKSARTLWQLLWLGQRRAQ